MKSFLGNSFPGTAVPFAVMVVLCLGLSGCPQATDSATNSPSSVTITGITVSPPNPSVAKGNTRTFTAVVAGTNNPPQTVTWTVEGGAAGTTIGSEGLLSVAAGETAGSLTVRATSTFDTTKSGRANVTVTGDTQYTVKYTLIFDSHGGSAVQAVTANEGTSISKPTDPEKTGYTFLGWFSAETGGTQYIWPYTVNGDTVMHAQWQDDSLPPPIQYTLTFNSHGGSSIPVITANEGTSISKPADPEKTGYTFLGWFSAETGGTQYAWPCTVNGDTVMHAQWQDNSLPPPVQYTLTFNSHGGSSIPVITRDAGTSIAKPSDSSRTGYTFLGWYSEAEGGTLYDWPHILTANVTVHAQWQENTHASTTGITFGGGPAAEYLGNLGNPAASITWGQGSELNAAVDTAASMWANGAAFAWYLDGVILSGETSAAITINAMDYLPGTHTLAVKVTQNGESYSKTVVFTILPAPGGST
jgi:uncharacterized repeat protein (TIGR02543 family)